MGNFLRIFNDKLAMLAKVFISSFVCLIQKTKVIWRSPYCKETAGCYPVIPLSVLLFVMYFNFCLLGDS